MRKLTMLLVLASVSVAQEGESPWVKKYKQKLKAGFIKKVPWEQDYDAAKKKAKEQGAVLFAYFSRSFAP